LGEPWVEEYRRPHGLSTTNAPRFGLTGGCKYTAEVLGSGAGGRAGNLSQPRGMRQAARTKEHGPTKNRTTAPATRAPHFASAAGRNVEGSTDGQIGPGWRGPGGEGRRESRLEGAQRPEARTRGATMGLDLVRRKAHRGGSSDQLRKLRTDLERNRRQPRGWRAPLRRRASR